MLIDDCLSCDIVAGKRAAPGGTIYQDAHWPLDSVLPRWCGRVS
jgi:hypothetical protein